MSSCALHIYPALLIPVTDRQPQVVDNSSDCQHCLYTELFPSQKNHIYYTVIVSLNPQRG